MTMTDVIETWTWTGERMARLEKLWTDGLSTQEIAGALGCSKNAVIGKGHRMDLPARPNPIVVQRLRQRERLKHLRSRR